MHLAQAWGAARLLTCRKISDAVFISAKNSRFILIIRLGL
ncbi:hypothetical protein yrohd0001_26620 [Yersinia rohdei ATCC 43380]|nr:hypothetical protein yrohd0001_26620 [Yersinia rohdei ATCC 43380]